MTTSQIEYLDPAKLVPYSINAKAHPKEQIEKIARQIKAHGFDVPIVVDKGFCIIKGHGRLLAAKKLKLKSVPVIVRADLTPEQVRLARIADNKVAESDWDMGLLKPELLDLQGAGADLTLTGWDDFDWLKFEINNETLSTDSDNPFAPDLPKEDPETKTNPGEFVLRIVFDSEDAQQELFIELRDRGFKVKV